MLSYFTSTPIYNSARLHYPQEPNSFWAPVDIRLVIQEYRIASAAKLTTWTGIASFSTSGNNSQGGSFTSYGQPDLPKITLGGYMDTPSTPVGNPNNRLPDLTRAYVNGVNRLTFGDYIAMNLEGRGRAFPNDISEFNPDYFIDGWGRVFGAPRIVEFSAAYVEGVPCRQTFSMTLQLTTTVSI